MKQTKNVPQLRFSGFDDEWENKEFSELFERRMERNNGQFGYDRWISVAKMYFQKPDKVTSNNIDTRTYVMRKSDIAFEGHSNKDYKLGRFVENDIGDGVISELFPIYKHIASYDLNYWKYAIQIERIMFPKLTKCIEISYTSSNKLDEYFFLKEHVLVPSCSEQKKIGTFISHVDSLIQAKTKKLESLKAVKKSLLQKCFPRAGEKVPEVRFAGFSGDWEEKKLGEIAVFSKGHGYSKNDLIPDGDPIILYGRMYTNYETIISNIETFVHKQENSVLSKGGEIIIPASGETAEDIARASVVKKAGIILGGDINIISLPKSVYDSSFVALSVSHGESQKELCQNAQGKTIVHLHNDDIRKISIMFPSLDEQQKIGQFFSKYDSLISAQQKEIDKLKDIKKSLLQKMFI